jgi:hypothetical protein
VHLASGLSMKEMPKDIAKKKPATRKLKPLQLKGACSEMK